MFQRFLIITMILLLSTTAFADRALKRQFDEMNREKRVALIIGNGNYKSSPLRNPVNDARSMAKILQRLNFKVLEYENLTQKQMKQAIDKFGREIRGGGVGLFFFAGHGMQARGRNYLIPVNADINTENDIEYESIDAGRVLAKMEDAGNRVNIVMIDACRNNPYARSFRAQSKGLATVNAPAGSFIAYATAPGSLAADGKGKNGVFTKAFVDAVNKNSSISIEKIFKKVRSSVRKTTHKKQTPWSSSSMEGDFYFKLPKTLAAMDKGSPSQSDRDTVFWSSISSSSNPSDYKLYIKKFPKGFYRSLAENRIKEFTGKTTKVATSVGKYTFSINADPVDATISILNIGPKYKHSMMLKSGKYHVQVSHSGYKTFKKWIRLNSESLTYDVTLKKKAVPSSSGFDLSDLEASVKAKQAMKDKERKRITAVKERDRKQKGVKLNEMKRAFVQIKAINEKDIDIEIKKEASNRFLRAFTKDLSWTLEDDQMRKQVKGMLSGEVTDSTTGMEFVKVPTGCFQMGDTFGDGDSDEKPVHEVCVDGFYMGKYEVTQVQWRGIMGSNPSHFSSCGNNCPVENVSWNDVQSFITKLNSRSGKWYKLPTEAEWEYAARNGGKSEKYSGSNTVGAVAWYSSNSGSKTHAVGQKQPNGFGLYDMSGNVWEWVQDKYDSKYYSRLLRNNPQGASSGSLRVLRGGSWSNIVWDVRLAYRNRGWSGDRSDTLGFRLALPTVQ